MMKSAPQKYQSPDVPIPEKPSGLKSRSPHFPPCRAAPAPCRRNPAANSCASPMPRPLDPPISPTKSPLPGPSGARELSPGSTLPAGAAPGPPIHDEVGLRRSGAARFHEGQESPSDPRQVSRRSRRIHPRAPCPANEAVRRWAYSSIVMCTNFLSASPGANTKGPGCSAKGVQTRRSSDSSML